MADYEQQVQGEEGQGQTPQRNHYQQFPQRSTASSNWRTKDDSPRAEPQPRQQRQFGGQRQSNSYGQDSARETSDTRLYVGNLLYSAKKDDIAQFFSDNGFAVANISMSIDPMTGRNPSYCFVDFDNPEEASRALTELNGKDVLGRTVRINPGMKRSEGQQGTYQQSGGPPRGGSWAGAQRDGGRQGYGYNRDSQQGQYGGYNQQSQEQTKRLYVGNLPAIESPEDVDSAVHSLFDPLGIEIVKISNLIAPHESKQGLGGDHHFLFVDLARPEDIDAAIEALDGKGTPWNAESTLKVNKAREQVRRQGYGQGGGYQSGGGYQGRRTEGQRDWRTTRTEEQ